MTGLVVEKNKKEKLWVGYIKQRIGKNKNFLGFVSGVTGSGKSWSCLSIAEQLDIEFDIDRCVFSGIELMDLINSGKLKKGSVIMFDEMGIASGHRDWQSITNKMINYLLQTFRHRNFILLMNAPYMDFIDASTRKLFHAEFKVVAIDHKKKIVRTKPQLIQYNPRIPKFYYKYLRVVTKDGVVPITEWGITKPSEELIDKYEEKKFAFTDKLNKKIYEELSNADKTKRKDLTEIQEEVLSMLKKGLNVDDICKECGRTSTSIYQSIRLIKKKGYGIKPVYELNKVIRYDIKEP